MPATISATETTKKHDILRSLMSIIASLDLEWEMQALLIKRLKSQGHLEQED